MVSAEADRLAILERLERLELLELPELPELLERLELLELPERLELLERLGLLERLELLGRVPQLRGADTSKATLPASKPKVRETPMSRHTTCSATLAECPLCLTAVAHQAHLHHLSLGDAERAVLRIRFARDPNALLLMRTWEAHPVGETPDSDAPATFSQPPPVGSPEAP